MQGPCVQSNYRPWLLSQNIAGKATDPIGIVDEKYKPATRLTLRALLALY